jgi:NADH:ubiquinone oxidoreductase subunit F (NADH-binding)/ferredoxin
MSPAAPEVISIGPPRLTAGLDRLRRIDLTGYQAIFGALPQLAAEQLIEMAAQADLRGRGGAAFPVARKLAAVLAAARSRRRAPVVMVNGAESDPASAKDKVLLLRSPYLVLGGAMTAARALGAREMLVAVSDPLAARSVREAIAAEPALACMVGVVEVPQRFVSGESSALIHAVNGRHALPSGRDNHASENGAGNLPTLLSNAETFAQLAVLAMAGPGGYASAGTAEEPGTVLLTIGGAVGRPAVVETPTGVPLGEVLNLCRARPAEGVLVGGYHGSWLPVAAAGSVPVSRAGLTAAGGTLGAGVVLVLGADSCPLGETARVAGYLAKESSGQCGPCRFGLPAIAGSLAAMADGSGGVDALEAVRRDAAAVRGRDACAHPDGMFRFVLSALEVFIDDVATHLFRGGCGRLVRGYLPAPAQPGQARLSVDWTRCRGHGLCAHLVPELMQMDSQGYPVALDMPVPTWLEHNARQAVAMCPALALSLVPAAPELAATLEPPWRPGGSHGHQDSSIASTAPDLLVSEDWIAEIAAVGGPGPGDAEPG